MSDDIILAEAASWHVRQDADDMDWQAFEAWLDVDARHRHAFDDIALLDEDIDRHRDTLRRLLPTPDHRASPEPIAADRQGWRRGWASGGAVGAAAALALVLTMRQTPAPQSPVPVTAVRASATARDVQIAGAQITLAPGSSVSTVGGEPLRLTLTGRALFSVKHDPARTVLVQAQGYDIRDVGTRFEVVAGAGIVRVSVAEGEVTIRASNNLGGVTRVAAGQVATGLADGTIATSFAGRAALGGWRSGALVYDAMPLGLVAADIARATGGTIVADSSIAGRSFSGVLAAGDVDAMVQTLATLAGVEARRQGDTIHLGSRVRR